MIPPCYLHKYIIQESLNPLTWGFLFLAISRQSHNQNISKYNRDTQARFGCKGKSKFWFGYKGHITADMSSGLIEYAAVTEANVSDQSGFKRNFSIS